MSGLTRYGADRQVRPEAGMQGTGRIADDLYLISHNDRTGRPLLQQRALGLGIAGGLLAELMLGGAIRIEPDGTLTARNSWPPDEAARRARDLVSAERHPLPVRDWLAFLAMSCARDVAGRLEQDGYLIRCGRMPGRQRYRPASPEWAFAPILRVGACLDASRDLRAHDTVLAGLAIAAGLWFRLEQYIKPAGRSLDAAITQLHPALRALITQTQAAVDSTIRSGRG